MPESYEPYFKIFIGDYYLKLGHSILFVTSHHAMGSYGAEYFGLFENEGRIFSKRIISREEEINGLMIGPDFLCEEAYKAGKGELLNYLGDQINDYSNIPVAFKDFELVQKKESDFIRLYLFNPSISEIIKSIIPETKCYELQGFISKVIMNGNLRFSEI